MTKQNCSAWGYFTRVQQHLLLKRHWPTFKGRPLVSFLFFASLAVAATSEL
jgi:hypothetical protein